MCCMDESALNYDADANTDTQKTVYGCDGEYVTVSVTTGSWAYELSWELMTLWGTLCLLLQIHIKCYNLF